MPKNYDHEEYIEQEDFDIAEIIRNDPSQILWLAIYIALVLFLVVRLLRWFWKVEQQVEQIRQLKEESGKTAILVEKIADQLKLYTARLYLERQELREQNADRHRA
jgi:cell shape-determining protein MreC